MPDPKTAAPGLGQFGVESRMTLTVSAFPSCSAECPTYVVIPGQFPRGGRVRPVAAGTATRDRAAERRSCRNLRWHKCTPPTPSAGRPRQADKNHQTISATWSTNAASSSAAPELTRPWQASLITNAFASVISTTSASSLDPVRVGRAARPPLYQEQGVAFPLPPGSGTGDGQPDDGGSMTVAAPALPSMRSAAE